VRIVVVLHLDLAELAPPTPHMPERRSGTVTQVAASAALHVGVFALTAWIASHAAPAIHVGDTNPADQELPRVVFLAPPSEMGGGGGGGGNHPPGPIRRAQGVGSDTITLRVRKPPQAPLASPPPGTENPPALPSIVLDAKPLASGLFDQIGLPTAGVLSGSSTGPGSGGGVGTGVGTGIGSGSGPGVGPGSGGGTGGGAYRPGGPISAPRLIKEVRPRYTAEALRNKIQGTVVLELIVTHDGLPSEIRVVRSLDPHGLDEQAVAAVAQWRFEPGRRAGTPVDVLVTIMLDFSIR